MITTLLLVLAAAPAASAAPASLTPMVTMVEPDAMHMSAAEIRVFNASVPVNHPFHIRCRREAEIGSLVRTIRSCRTNRQWAHAEQVGNENARETMDRMTSKFTNTN